MSSEANIPNNDHSNDKLIYYGFSKGTFPVNRKLRQYQRDTSKEDILYECALLAERILGVPRHDSVGGVDTRTGKARFFQITLRYPCRN